MQVGIVKSFLFSRKYYSAFGLTDTLGENACGFGSSVGKFSVRQQQALVKANFPFKLFAGTTSFTGVGHYSLPAASIPPSLLPCSGMSCPTARVLFEEYSKATMEYYTATDNLPSLVGRHKEFAEAKKHTEEAHVKCLTARRTLEQRWQEHRCRAREAKTTDSC
jgi:hypothetical protein